MSETKPCASCGEPTPVARMALTSSGAVCAACEAEVAHFDEPVAPQAPTAGEIFGAMPLQIFATCAAIFTVLGIMVAIGIVLGFTVRSHGTEVPPDWRISAVFIAIGVVCGAIARVLSRRRSG